MIDEAPSAGVLLSPDGMKRVRERYDAFRKAKLSDLSELIKKASAELLWSDWRSYDQLYEAMYVSNLARSEGKIRPELSDPDKFQELQDETAQSNLARYAVLEVALDASLPQISSGAFFSNTLLDEFVVSDLQHFRLSVARMIPFSTRVEKFKLDHVRLEFGMYALAGLKPEVTDAFITAIDLDRPSSAWKALRQRFRVTQLKISNTPIS
jgi:hypothetical protein